MEMTIDFQKIQPKAWQAMKALEEYLSTITLSEIHKELIKIRASQINGCSFCINLHTNIALKHGEKKERIFQLHEWRDSNLFTPEEKAILHMTEEITNIAQGISDNTYKLVSEYFSQELIAQIIMTITIINSWNRISISSGMKH